MQDNQEPKFDEHFVDQAWENMRMLLDQEMPAAPAPKRKAAAWWWMAGLGTCLLIAVLGVAYFSLQAVYISAFPLAIADDASAIQDHPQTDRPDQIIQASLSPGQPISTDEKPNLIRQTTTTSATTATPLMPDVQLPATNNKHDLHPQPPMKPENLKSNTADRPANRLQAASKAAPFNTFRTLPLPSATRSVFADSPFSAPEATAIEPVRSKKGFKLSIEGSIHSIGLQNINGYGVAVLAEKHHPTNRLYFKAGLGYDVINPDIVASEQQLVFENTALYRGSENSTTISTHTALTALQKSYLSINLGYQLSNKIAVEAGIQPSYIHSSTMQETWSHSTAASSRPTPFVSRITANPTSIQSRQLVFTAGLQYQLNPSLGLRLNYQHGTTNLFDTSYDEAYLRAVKVAFAYYIR
jgi:hypothetical protein